MAAHVDVTGGELVVRVTGMDVVWALSRGVRVPVAQVRNVSVRPRADAGRRRVLRLGGTAFPGVVKAGRYGWRGWRELWVTRWPERVLVVTCAPGAPYDLVVLEVPDPDGEAARIGAALAVR